MEPLDEIDRALIGHLQKNARLSNKELAHAVHLSQSSCLQRVRSLTARGVFRGFHAEVDAKAVGIGLEAVISIRLRHHARPDVEAFWAHVIGLPEVLAVYHIGGRTDFLVHVGARDADHLRTIAMDAFTTRDEVAQIETAVVFDRHRREVVPVFGDEPGDSKSRRDDRPIRRKR